MIKVKQKGDFSKSTKFLKKMSTDWYIDRMNHYGQLGVEALQSATPKDSGRTAESWYYEIENRRDGCSIVWSNRNTNDGVNIAIILQYGHGTGTGGFVQGRDYINPAIQPIFDRIAESAWKEVVNS